MDSLSIRLRHKVLDMGGHRRQEIHMQGSCESHRAALLTEYIDDLRVHF